GGRLVNPPEKARELMENFKIKRSPVEWALLWVWNHPEVTMLLSGMSTLEQVKENIEIADKAEVGILTPEELQLIERVRDIYLGIKAIDCTQCMYCVPCPYGVNIPQNFYIYNEGVRYNSWEAPRWHYNYGMKPEERAEFLRECKEMLNT
ncbi:MAG: aldo/keto reductase, partial [Dictyoglomus sp.]